MRFQRKYENRGPLVKNVIADGSGRFRFLCSGFAMSFQILSIMKISVIRPLSRKGVKAISLKKS